MKKIISMVVVLAALVVPTVTAQKINTESFNARMEKSDADIANPKKAGKAATWLNRAKILQEAITAPTKGLYGNGLDVSMLNVILGVNPTSTNGDTYSYEWVDIYSKNKKVVGWKIKKEVIPNAFQLMMEAYEKAYELDSNTIAKTKSAVETLNSFYTELGAASLNTQNYKEAIDAYVKAIDLQSSPAIRKVDPNYYFFAGQLAAYLGTENVQYFIDGEKYLTQAKDLGFTDEQGNLYYFLFHCYYGQREADKENIVKAKNILLEGIEKYPQNERIMEGLIQLYTSKDNVGNPAELVGRLDKMLSEKPENADLWFARGQIFFKLKNFDECINSFLKVNELRPNDYDANFYLGYFYIAKGDEVNRNFNKRLDSISSQEEYQAGLKEVSRAYMKALPYFEKAMEIRPDAVDCAEYLKQLCFRLRDEEGVMDKYNKYNAIYKKLKGIQ
ncbi:MAG: tetratricopeptide repeat protein [Alistipes sp.]|nr:tetratricopeptide repeat protein [Alistipes sp.]